MSDDIHIDITEVVEEVLVELQEAQDGDPGPPGTTSWAGITDKPAAFPPSEHTHPWSEITDRPGTIYLTEENLLPTERQEMLTLTGGVAHGEPLEPITFQRIADINGYAAWSVDGSAPNTVDGIYVDDTFTTRITYYGSQFTCLTALQPVDYATADWEVPVEGDTPGAWDFSQLAIESMAAGQLARWGDAEPYRWFVALEAAALGAWVEILRRDGDYGKPTALDLSHAALLPPAGFSGVLPVDKGGTGASTPQGAVTALTAIENNANTSITLTPDHSGSVLRCTAATEVTITVSGDLGVNFSCLIIQAGPGQVTVVPAGGSLINGGGAALQTSGRHSRVHLYRVSAFSYNAGGDLRSKPATITPPTIASHVIVDEDFPNGSAAYALQGSGTGSVPNSENFTGRERGYVRLATGAAVGNSAWIGSPAMDYVAYRKIFAKIRIPIISGMKILVGIANTGASAWTTHRLGVLFDPDVFFGFRFDYNLVGGTPASGTQNITSSPVVTAQTDYIIGISARGGSLYTNGLQEYKVGIWSATGSLLAEQTFSFTAGGMFAFNGAGVFIQTQVATSRIVYVDWLKVLGDQAAEIFPFVETWS